MAMPGPARALVVTPSEALRILIGGALRRASASRGRRIDVVEAKDGFLALFLAGRERFDVVVADLDLPVLPADELVRFLRARPEQELLPVVVVSEDAAGEEAGFPARVAVAPAPFTPETLAAALARAGFRFGEDE